MLVLVIASAYLRVPTGKKQRKGYNENNSGQVTPV